MTAKNVAIALKAWAIENHVFQTDFPIIPPTPDNDRDALVDSFQISAASENILRKRAITGIGVNDARNEVIVFTQRNITKGELKLLPKLVTDANVTIRYIQGGLAQAGAPNNGGAQAPYSQFNGRYACGSSIHPARHVGAGTIGCLVKDAAGQIYGLTNNHVSGMCSYSLLGEKILAPGHVDIAAGGIDPFTIGYHHSSLPMPPGVPDNIDVSNNLDAALLKIADTDTVSSMQGTFFDTPAQEFDLQANQTVEKVGRTTGHRTGTVLCELIGAFPVTYNVPALGTQICYFDPVYVVLGTAGTFSEGGDSGSLVTSVINGVRHAVGLVFAGDNHGKSYILPLRPILANLNVTLLSGHNI